ncbi:MAG: thiamine phosphate synthase [bacterium]
MKRIIDANLNRATEALRVLEEITRFYLDDEKLSEKLKNIRHNISKVADESYEDLLFARDTVNDVGTNIHNPTQRKDILNIFKANIKRLQQSLRTLAEYAQAENMDFQSFEKARYDSYTLEKEMYENLSSKLNKFRLQDKNLYLVTSSDNFENEDDFLNAVASAFEGGVRLIQLREKSHDAQKIIRLGKKIRELASIYDAIFILNDRIDIAQIVDADGVHLGQDDVDIKDARNILGDKMIIGISTHCPEQAQKAVEQGADYIGVGPIFTTPTKPGRTAVTTEYAKWVAKNIAIPWFAIGGIDLSNIKEVLDAGANRIAVVRAIINAQNPSQAAIEFLNVLNISNN